MKLNGNLNYYRFMKVADFYSSVYEPVKHFCNKTGEACELATDFGYCKVSACTNRGNAKAEPSGVNFCDDCYWYSAEREYCLSYECHTYNAAKCVRWEPKGNTINME